MIEMVRKYRVLAPLLLAALVIGFACEEREVEGILDADEIRRYIAETEIGRELFRTDSLILPDPYQRPGDTTIFSDTVIAHTREISIDTIATNASGDQLANWGALGFLREGIAIVQDRFTVVTRKLNIPGSSPDTTSRVLVRAGLFLKLFNDGFPYLGWDLWAFSGTGNVDPTNAVPLQVGVTIENDAGVQLDQFRGDDDAYTITPRKLRPTMRFVEIRQIAVTTSGVQFILETELRNAQSPARYYSLLSGSQEAR
ncbi:hypothetical protein GF420_11060, partial [candidate division GN15 bacterium]|nr:hypothetical protein [candidate division GN15 bacterium]